MKSPIRRVVPALAVLLLAGTVPTRADTTYTVVTDRDEEWTQTVTLPEFPENSKLLAHLQLTDQGDGWDRHGEVTVDTPEGRVDIVKFTTDFGGSYWFNAVDITRLRPLLKGQVTFRGKVEDRDGLWRMTFRIEEISGGNTGEVSRWVKPVVPASPTVWAPWLDSFPNGTTPKPYKIQLPNLPPSGKVYLTYYTSGHGSGPNGCEFRQFRHKVWVDGTQVFNAIPWREGRSNWVPGDTVDAFTMDVTSALDAPLANEHTIEFLVEGDMGDGFWYSSAFLHGTASPTAATYHWDVNGTTAGFGTAPGGTWGASASWSTSSAGTSTTANPATTILDTVYFGTDTTGFTNSGTVDIDGGGVSVGNIHVGAGNAQDFSLGNSWSSITLAATSTITYNTAGKWFRIYPKLAGGTTKVTFAGNGTIVPFAAAAYTGDTAIDDATLKPAVAGFLPNGKSVSLLNTGTLDLNGNNQTVRSVDINNSGIIGTGTLALNNGGGRGIYNSDGNSTVNGKLELASGTPTPGGNNLDFGAAADTTLTLNGVISSAAGYGMDIYGSGGGTVKLGAVNTFTGPVKVERGTLQYGVANALHDSSAVTVISGQVIDLNGFSDTIASLSLNGNGSGGNGALRNNGAAAATLTSTGGITLTGNASVGGSADIALPNPVSGSGFGLTKTGANTLTLSGANNYTGATTVNQGTLTIGPGGSLSSASLLSIAPGAVVNFSQSAWNAFGATQQGGTWTIAGTLRATTPQANTVVAHVSLNNGTLDSTGGAPTGYGAFYLAGKTITANGAANTISGNGRVGITGTVTLNTPLATDALDISAAVGATSAQSGGLTKTGAGTVTLSGSNTYTGATSVGQGVLLVNAPGSLSPNSNLTVAPAATLGGSGTAGAVSLGGILAPGNSAGTLTTGAVFFQPGSTYQWDLANWTGTTPGTHWDRLAAASLAFNNTTSNKLTIRILGPFANFSEANKTFAIAIATGAITGFNPSNIAIDATGFPGTGTWSIQQNAGTIELKYTVNNYAAWAAAFPGFTDTDPAHDPDGDGLDNFTEYAFGLDPTKGTSASPATAPDRSTGTFTYTRRKPALTGLTCIYQSSTALGGWTAFTPVSATSNNGNPVETITVTIPAALLAEPKLFLRVTATEP